jgi:hypothetical protein
VTEDGAGAGVFLQDEMEVAATDPALSHLDKDFVRSRLGDGDLLDGDGTVTDIDGGRHGRRNHGQISAWFR